MAGNAEALIREAAAVLSEAMDEAAAIALLAVEKYGATLQTFCKQVCEEAGMPEAWNALRNRAQRLQTGRSRDWPSALAARETRAVKRLVSEPETAAAIPHDDKVALARTLLEDQGVVADVMADRVSRKSIRQAAEDADYLDHSERPRREAAADIAAVAEVQERITAVNRAIRTLSEVELTPDEFALQVRNREPDLLETWDEAIPRVVSFLQELRRRIKVVL